MNFNGIPYGNGKKGIFRDKTVPVGSLPPNKWGLYEIHGNVSQFCSDWIGPYPTGDVVDPQGPPTGTQRVLRGCSWYDNAASVRAAGRSYLQPTYRQSSHCGLRVAAAIGP